VVRLPRSPRLRRAAPGPAYRRRQEATRQERLLAARRSKQRRTPLHGTRRHRPSYPALPHTNSVGARLYTMFTSTGTDACKGSTHETRKGSEPGQTDLRQGQPPPTSSPQLKRGGGLARRLLEWTACYSGCGLESWRCFATCGNDSATAAATRLDDAPALV
jgi:hypothetical protein